MVTTIVYVTVAPDVVVDEDAVFTTSNALVGTCTAHEGSVEVAEQFPDESVITAFFSSWSPASGVFTVTEYVIVTVAPTASGPDHEIVGAEYVAPFVASLL